MRSIGKTFLEPKEFPGIQLGIFILIGNVNVELQQPQQGKTTEHSGLKVLGYWALHHVKTKSSRGCGCEQGKENMKYIEEGSPRHPLELL